jgi:hypothetical protein
MLEVGGQMTWNEREDAHFMRLGELQMPVLGQQRELPVLAEGGIKDGCFHIEENLMNSLSY